MTVVESAGGGVVATPLAEGGKVWVPEPAKALWMRGWMQEVVGFPELKHDDRCDAMSMALQRLRSYVEPYCLVVPGVRVDLDEVEF